METNRKIWKKYSDHKQYLKDKSKQIPPNSYLDSKPSIQIDYKILDLRKNENVQKKKEKVLFPTMVNINKHFDSDIKEKTIRLRNFIIGKLWKKYSLIAIHKEYYGRTRNEKVILDQSQQYKTFSRKNISIAYSALLLFKIVWKIWFRYSNIIIEKKK